MWLGGFQAKKTGQLDSSQQVDLPAEEPAVEDRTDTLVQGIQGGSPGQEGVGTFRIKFEKGSEEKQELAQRRERKRLNILDSLKSYGGPFTDAGEVDQYLDDQSMDDKGKQRRMKLEIQFAGRAPLWSPKLTLFSEPKSPCPVE